MANPLRKLTRDKFIPLIDINKDKTMLNNDWARVNFSTINTLTMNEQTEDYGFICYAEDITEVNSNKPEVELETTLQENEPVYDFLINHFQSLPTGDDCNIPMLYLFGGEEQVAWRAMATISSKALDTTGGKITWTSSMFNVEVGNYRMEGGKPIFIPSSPHFNITFSCTNCGMYRDSAGREGITSLRVAENSTIETSGNIMTITDTIKGEIKLYAVPSVADYEFKGFYGIETPVNKDLVINVVCGAQTCVLTFPNTPGGAIYDNLTGGDKVTELAVEKETTIVQSVVANVGVLEITEPGRDLIRLYAIPNEGCTFLGFGEIVSPVAGDQTITYSFDVPLEQVTVSFASSSVGGIYTSATGGDLVSSIDVYIGTELNTYAVGGVGVLEFIDPYGDKQQYYARANEGNYFVGFEDYVSPIETATTITAIYDATFETVTFTNSDEGSFYDVPEGGTAITSLEVAIDSDVIASYNEGVGIITFIAPGQDAKTVYCIPAEGNYYLNPGTIPTKVTSAFTITPEFTDETVTITFATSEDGAMYDEIEAGLVVTEATVIKGSEITDITHAGIGIIKFNAAGIEQKFYAIANEGKSWSDFADYDTPATEDMTITPQFSSAAPVPPIAPEIKDNLDKYTLEELSELSNYLEYVNEWTPEALETDEQYLNIKALMEAGSIWFSNSNGEQTATFEDMSSFDETKCNADYKCNFLYQDAAMADYRQFLNLRIVGILHDYNEEGKKIGLTLQSIRAFGCGQSIAGASATDNINWNNCWLFNPRWGIAKSQGFTQLADNIKNVIKPCVKAYQATRATEANIEYNTNWIFAPAYGEIVANNPKISKYPWMNNNGTEFKPATCEGYTYEYYNKIGTQGSGNQEALAKLCKDNKELTPINASKQSSLWLRTVDDSSNKSFSVINYDGNPYAFVSAGTACMLLTFCI